MEKCYSPTEWENEPSKKTPINEVNLLKLENGVDTIDTRVCELAGYEERAAESEKNAVISAEQAGKSAEASQAAADEAEVSEKAAESSAALSKSYAVGGTGTRAEETTDNAKYYKEQAETARDGANTYAVNAKVSEQAAKSSETNAEKSADTAGASAKSASESASTAGTAAVKAGESAASAANSAASVGDVVEQASESAAEAESFAHGGTGIREGEDTDNAQYYKEQAERISQGLKGALLPMGTIAFADLPDTSSTGYMYNISDEFTTTERFKEGSGNKSPAGTNVYYTADGYWDCMAGSPVTGVKGYAESSYHKGNVNITKANVGLGNVPNVTTNNQTPTFTQAGTRANLVSGEKLNILLGKIMKWFTDLKNGAFSSVANNDTTTNAGYVADARIVKVHGDEIDKLSAEVSNCLKSVSDGKSTVAGVITAQGVNTAADAEFTTMAANITTVATNKYNTGYGKGVTDADARANPGSINYQSGYNVGYSAGVTAADARSNPGSVNYQSGYNAGYSAGAGSVSLSTQSRAGTIYLSGGGGEGTPTQGTISLGFSFPHGVLGVYSFATTNNSQFPIHSISISGNTVSVSVGNTITWWTGNVTATVYAYGY